MEHTDWLQGRIIALELLVQGFMVQATSEQTDLSPSQCIRDREKTMKSSLQHLPRPVNESSDQIWEAAADSLTLLFSNARIRIDKQSE